MIGLPNVLTIRQAAAVAGETVDKVRRWADRGKIPVYQSEPNTTRFIRVADLEAACEARGIEPNWDVFADYL